MQDLYDHLLEELGKLLDIPLKPDAYNSCLIHFEEEKVDVQIEIVQGQEMVVIGSNIAEVPPGRYKEDLFEQALKANYLDNPRGAILAYSPISKNLVAFLTLPLKELQAIHIADQIPSFLQKVKTWKDSMESNQLPPLQMPQQAPRTGSSMFGL